MALVNPNIALGIRQPEFTPRNAMADYAQMQQIMNAQDTQQMNALKLQEARFLAENRNSLRGLNFDAPDYVSQVAKYDPKLASEIAKERATIASQQAAARASGAAADKSGFELTNLRRKFGDDLKRGLSANPSDENIIAFGQDAVLQNLYPKDQVEATVRQLLALPPAERVRILSQSGASAGELKPSIQQVNQGGQTQMLRVPAFGGEPTVAGTYADVPLPANVQAQKVQKAAASAPIITVSTEKKYGERFGGLIADQDAAKLSAAENAPSAAATADRVLDLIGTGKVITGTGANVRLQIAKALNLAGGTDSEKIKNTEVLVSSLAETTLGAIKSSNLGAGQGFTNADRDFLEKAKAGQLTYDSGSLAELARLARLAAEKSAESWNTRVKKIPATALEGTGISTQPVIVPPRKQKATSASPAPKGVDQALWNVMTPEERKLWQK
jgi:hypothetical protein